jgi:hypothetical protein
VGDEVSGPTHHTAREEGPGGRRRRRSTGRRHRCALPGRRDSRGLTPSRAPPIRRTHESNPRLPERVGSSRAATTRTGMLIPCEVGSDLHNQALLTRTGTRWHEPSESHRHMAPVTRCIPDADQQGFAETPRLLERLRSPLPPVDRILRVLQQVWARGAGESVRHAPHLSSLVHVRTNAESPGSSGFAAFVPRRDARNQRVPSGRLPTDPGSARSAA